MLLAGARRTGSFATSVQTSCSYCIFINKQYILQQASSASTEQALHEPQPQAEVEHVELSN